MRPKAGAGRGERTHGGRCRVSQDAEGKRRDSGRGPGERGLGPAGRLDWRGVRRELEIGEDGADEGRIGDGGDKV